MAKRPPAKTDSTALTKYDYGQDANAGFTDQHGEDLLIPFIDVLQPLSPQLEEIHGAKPGMLFNSVTNETYEHLHFVPAYRDWNFVEFISRDEGGGFVGVHAPESPVVVKARAGATGFDYKTPDGHELVETFYLYAILVDGNGDQIGMGVIRFQSTKIKVYKGLMTQLRTIRVDTPKGKVNPPLFAYKLELSTVKQENKKGKWFNFTVRPVGDTMKEAMLAPDNELYTAAKQLCAMVDKGFAKPAYESMDQGGDDDTPF